VTERFEPPEFLRCGKAQARSKSLERDFNAPPVQHIVDKWNKGRRHDNNDQPVIRRKSQMKSHATITGRRALQPDALFLGFLRKKVRPGGRLVASEPGEPETDKEAEHPRPEGSDDPQAQPGENKLGQAGQSAKEENDQRPPHDRALSGVQVRNRDCRGQPRQTEEGGNQNDGFIRGQLGHRQ